MKRAEIGLIGEQVAQRYLRGKGFHICAVNERFSLGEIDIIAEKEGITHFVEVKTSVARLPAGKVGEKNEHAADPIERISREKLRKMKNAVLLYVKGEKKGIETFQLDAISVLLNERTRHAKVQYVENILG